MLTVEHYARIRRARRDGLSIRAIATTFRHGRRKVRQVLADPEPRPYTRTKEPSAPKLGPFKAVIEEILREDEAAPRKQRHLSTQIFRRLVKEHQYPGGYDQVRRYVGSKRRRERETFIPLSHDPGQRMEADFGQIHVDFPDGRRAVHVLLVTWAWSYCPFAIALPTERTEAIRHARGDWLFWMDSDDTISAENGQKLRELALGQHKADTLGYVMQVHCPGDEAQDVTVVDHVKLFRDLSELRFEFRIHEQLLPAIRRLNGQVEWTDLFVVHSGSDHSTEGRRRKQQRDLRLLELELADRPDHPFALFNLGMTYSDMERPEEAVSYQAYPHRRHDAQRATSDGALTSRNGTRAGRSAAGRGRLPRLAWRVAAALRATNSLTLRIQRLAFDCR